MALQITANWSQPIELIKGNRHNFIYYSGKIDSISNKPGVYVFAREFGEKVHPIYVGRADNFKKRIEQQTRSVPLMKGIENSPNGKRILIYCEAVLKKGQDRKKVVALIENSLIDHALSEGDELLNKHGTKRPTHTIQFKGNRVSEGIAPRKMFIKSALIKSSSGRKQHH